MQMKVDSARDGLVHICFIGEMTIYHVNDIRQGVLTQLAEAGELELDLSGVSEIDSAGLQVLMAAKKEAKARNKLFRLTAHSQAVVDLLDISKLSGFFGDPILLHGEARPGTTHGGAA